MKRRFTILTAAFALLVCLAFPMGVWGQTRTEVTDVLNQELTGVTGTSYTEWSGKTSNSDAVWAGQSAGGNSSIQLRSNNSNSGIITTTSGGTVTKVVVTWNSNTSNGRTLNIYGKNTAYSAATDLYNSQTQGTLIGTIVYGTNTELSITDNYEFIGMRSASGAMYLTKVDVTWENGAASTDPTISAENVNIGYNTENGEIEFTINNPVEGGVLTADTEAEWLTIGEVGNETVPFTCTANETAIARTASVVLTYTYNTDQTVTKNVTITQAGDPNATITIAEARAQGTGAVVTRGIITSIIGSSSKTAYIQDATAAIVVYGSFTAVVGDEIRVSGTLSNYNGLLEITNPSVTVLSSSNTVEPEVMTVAEAAISSNQGWYIRIEEATVNAISNQNVTIAQDESTIEVRFTSADDVDFEVNNIISLDGNIGSYNGNNQIANPQNVTVQQSEEPAILVDPTTVNVPCAAAEGTLTVTYQNIETELGPEIYWYESDGTTTATYDWIDADFDGDNNVYYVISANEGEARTAYMKVYGVDADLNDVYSELITFSQGHYISDYATLPFEFDGGKADIEGTAGLTQEGLGSDYSSSPKLKFDGTGDWLILHFNERPGTLTFDIKGNSFSGGTFKVQTSADGVSYSDLETYDTFGNNETLEEIFNDLDENVRYIKWIYTNKASGNVGLGNIKLAKYTGPVASITISDATVNIPAEGAEGTLTVAYENITEIIADVYFCDAEGEAASYDWIEAEINSENNVDYIIDVNDGDARTAYMKVYALDDNAEDVYSNLVTINQAAYVAPIADGKYVKVSSTADLTSGQYLIVYEEGSLAFNGSLETLDAVGNTIEVILNNNEIAVTETTTASEFTINTTNGTIKSASGYYIGQTSDANGMASSIETAYTNTITITDGNADIVSSGAYLRYNSASNQTRFRYYKSSSYTGQKAIQLYKKVVEPETYTLDITGYGSNPGGYYLIASPVASVTPSTENGFLTEAYDLYEFDQSADNEWVNYEQHGFDIVSGKGYLYASQANTTLTFEGQPYNGNGKIDLVYDENANLAGWNLIGNPFGVTATVDHDYYIMNENGDNFMLTSKETPIDAMQGIFILTESADDNKAVFTTEEPATPGEKLVLNVTHNRGVVDRAMIRFGESQQMPKAMLSPNNTKIYIEQTNNDYAVVRSDNESEMPISFKAADNGTYTLSIDADNVEMDYLHLVDNMTGMDVDLLANPSYTFEANTTDYACRFKLVYKNTTGIEESSEHFAYFNGNEWVVSNEGDAQLHVIDMTGRIVSNETLNGNATIKVNAAPGVYMLRLVNGNDTKTQKVIIK